jgi:hypothetical protein
MLVPYKGDWLHIVHITGAVLFALGFYSAILWMGYKNKDRYVQVVSKTVAFSILGVLLLFASLSDLRAILFVELGIGLFGHTWILLMSLHQSDIPSS